LKAKTESWQKFTAAMQNCKNQFKQHSSSQKPSETYECLINTQLLKIYHQNHERRNKQRNQKKKRQKKNKQSKILQQTLSLLPKKICEKVYEGRADGGLVTRKRVATKPVTYGIS
jgi:hypothetical protein